MRPKPQHNQGHNPKISDASFCNHYIAMVAHPNWQGLWSIIHVLRTRALTAYKCINPHSQRVLLNVRSVRMDVSLSRTWNPTSPHPQSSMRMNHISTCLELQERTTDDTSSQFTTTAKAADTKTECKPMKQHNKDTMTTQWRKVNMQSSTMSKTARLHHVEKVPPVILGPRCLKLSGWDPEVLRRWTPSWRNRSNSIEWGTQSPCPAPPWV